MRRILIVPAVLAAMLLAGCNSGPKCAAPLVAVDHGHYIYIPQTHMAGKTPVTTLTPVWQSDWRCEEKGGA